MVNTYLVGEFAKLIGKTVSTLQRWDREGTLIANRTPTGRRFYTHEQYLTYNRQQSSEKGEVVGYVRISDIIYAKSLEYQKELIKKYCLDKNLSVDRWIEDIGSAMTFDRIPFNSMLEFIEIGRISKVIVAHDDRVIRIGFEWFKKYCLKYGTEVIVLSNTVIMDINLISPQEEMEKDLEVISLNFARLKKNKKLFI